MAITVGARETTRMSGLAVSSSLLRDPLDCVGADLGVLVANR
jgi:hypothetical protein